MKNKEYIHRLLLVVMMQTLFTLGIFAQEYKVVSFRYLANDVSAFISPVKDNNDDACALIKVIAPKEFAFSAPMGIVKRIDEVGEIWLYVPNGTKTLTLKHPKWGVLRDYRLSVKLKSHNTYELQLSFPQTAVEIKHDTVTMVQLKTDTIAVPIPLERTPFKVHALTAVAVHRNGPSYGLIIGLLRKTGVYIHAQSRLSRSVKTEGECDADGRETDKAGQIPYYSGATSISAMRLTAGIMQRLTSSVCMFEGAGYGNSAVAWQLTENDGGIWLKNNDLSYSGVALEVGCICSMPISGKSKVGKALDLSLSTSTIAGSHWQLCVGIGVRL